MYAYFVTRQKAISCRSELENKQANKTYRIKRSIRQFHISHNAPYLPPTPTPPQKVNLCFSFFLGITALPRGIENNAYAKFWGANKAHYAVRTQLLKTSNFIGSP